MISIYHVCSLCVHIMKHMVFCIMYVRFAYVFAEVFPIDSMQTSSFLRRAYDDVIHVPSLKIDMEPEHHPFAKEKHLNQTSVVFKMLIFGV